MAHRLEVVSTIPDMRAEARKRDLAAQGFDNLRGLKLVDVFNLSLIKQQSP